MLEKRVCECDLLKKYSLSNISKDGEPDALKGASPVRGGGHAMPTG